MPLILGILSIIGIALVWYWRAKMAREAAGDVVDAANDVRLAARRLMFKRRHTVHPADAVDDPRLAAAGIAIAVATMDEPASQSELRTLSEEARRVFSISDQEAEDITSFGRWIAGQCKTEGEAVRRLSKRVAALAGPDALPDLTEMVGRVATADGNELSDAQQEALRLMTHTVAGRGT